MKIRPADHIKLSPDRMTKVTLATTARAQLDLYCVGSGQSQAAHTHADQDKIYYVLEGSGRFVLDGREERLERGDALMAPAGVEHGLVNDGAERLLVLVVVTPPRGSVVVAFRRVRVYVWLVVAASVAPAALVSEANRSRPV